MNTWLLLMMLSKKFLLLARMKAAFRMVTRLASLELRMLLLL